MFAYSRGMAAVAAAGLLAACSSASNEASQSSSDSLIVQCIDINCGGIGQKTCCYNTCETGLTNMNGTCGVPPTVMNMGTIGVTGPLVLENNDPGANFQYGLADTRRPGPPYFTGPTVDCPTPPPLPPILNTPSEPKWAMGNGFSVDDPLQGQTPQKFYVPGPDLTLQATLSYSDDSGKFPVEIWPQPFCPQSWIPHLIEGNHAHYTVTVQTWVDNTATNVQTCRPNVASPNPTDSPGVSFANSPDGLAGCWVDLANEASDLYGPTYTPQTLNPSAPPNGTVSTSLSIPVSLPGVSNWVRYYVTMFEDDSRDPSSANGAKWEANPPPDWPLVNPPVPPCIPNASPGWCQEVFGMNHPTNGQFAYVGTLSPFQLVVLPQALAQLKVLPYTLLYAPPGNASKATYQTSTSFGVSMAFQGANNTGTSTTIDTKNSTLPAPLGGMLQTSIGGASGATTSTGTSSGGSTGSSGSGGDAKIGIGPVVSSSTTWDSATTTGVGTTTTAATTQMGTYQTTFQWTLSDSTLTPGASGTENSEPFWDDTFVLLVHPQVGLWQVGGRPVASLLAARGTPATPEFITPTVAELNACLQKTGSYANGFPIVGTNDVLTSAECGALLALDPLYSTRVGTNVFQGQSAPWLTAPAGNGRFAFATGTQYGNAPDPTGKNMPDQGFQFTTLHMYQNMTTTQGAAAYNASLTDVITTSNTFGGSLSAYGITAGVTFNSTETNTNGATWAVSLQTSQTATAQSSITVTGALDDHHGSMGTAALPYEPSANIYQDAIFGSFLFQDPTAPEKVSSVVLRRP